MYNNFSEGYTRLSSRALAEQFFLQKNLRILGILFRRHKDAVYRQCRLYLQHPVEAEDATMEIFERLARHLQKYPIRHFQAWLMRFTRNYCLQRKAKRRQVIGHTAEMAHLIYAPWEDGQADAIRFQDNRIKQLYRAMDQLKCHQRECLVRFYFEERSYREIAHEMHLPTKAVKSHIQNGKRKLRLLLSKGSSL